MKRTMTLKESIKEKNIVLKIILLGQTQVGKSSLLIRFCDKTFCSQGLSTIGIDYKTKYFKFDNQKVKINYIDTAGQEKFYSLSSNFLKSANGVILVYDITNEDSLLILENWMKNLMSLPEKLPTILLGNKSDLNDKREISFEQGKSLAKKLNMLFYEVSANSGENVDKAFEEISNWVYEENQNFEVRDSFQLQKNKNIKKKEKAC